MWSKDQIMTISEFVNERFSDLINNLIFKAMAVFIMDTTSLGDEVKLANMQVIVEKFHRQLVAN